MKMSDKEKLEKIREILRPHIGALDERYTSLATATFEIFLSGCQINTLKECLSQDQKVTENEQK